MHDVPQQEGSIGDGLVKEAQDARKEALGREPCSIEGRLGANTDVNKDDEGEVAVTGYGHEYTRVRAESVAVVVGNSLDSDFDIAVDGQRTDVLAHVHEPAEEVDEST